ncbi:MAG: hypothetical protein KatS3mg065_1204 [Chloroflexota bacterium]|nr:MAG: hypothetical protein KatS3mg065_1204 [Chloroflexota bacterium]
MAPTRSSQDFSLTDAATPHDSGALKPGTYSVSETVPAGWDLTGASCSDESDPAQIDLAPGETVTCTFTNTKRGTIIVEKQTNPDGATDEFTFTGDAAGTIADGEQIVVSEPRPRHLHLDRGRSGSRLGSRRHRLRRHEQQRDVADPDGDLPARSRARP